MNIWHDVSMDRIQPDNFLACIEIPAGCKNKYELDKKTGALILDRILYTSTHYPQNYGFIPRTYAGDNDPLDVLVICSEPIVPLALVQCYPIGIVNMVDSGQEDEKIIAVCAHDPIYSQYREISELPEHIFDEICHFFKVYKDLEKKNTQVLNIEGRKKAIEVVDRYIKEYDKRFGEKEKV